jgi:3-hydroxyacyl-[acyl-carrier-protein] dehydratase
LFKIEDIERFLPHRYPFLFIDRVLEMEKGKSIVALKNVSANEAFFRGHFPKKKIMPGVLIVEALAQAGGVLLYHSLPDPENSFVFLSKIQNARFRRTVVPGDQIRLEVSVTRFKNRFYFFQARALVDGELAVEAELAANVLHFGEKNER